MIALDTSTLIDLLRGDEEVKETVSGLDERAAVCHPILCELYKGVYKSSDPEKGEKELEKLSETLKVLESDVRSAKVFGKLKQRYPALQEFDLMIASICISHDVKLMTEDNDFRRIEELQFADS